MKKFNEIKGVLNISESQYREEKAYNYSLLAKYSNEGVKALREELLVETPSIVFGSLVDCLLTDRNNFNNLFYISNACVTDSIKAVIDYLTDTLKIELPLEDVCDNYILHAVEELNYQSNWKNQTRIDKVRKEGEAYYNAKLKGKNKYIITYSDYKEALDLCKEIVQGRWSRWIWEYKDKSDVEFLYQQKLKYCMKNNNSTVPVNIKAMYDLLVVNHKNKVIAPFDIKTTSSSHFNFNKSFYKWRYDIQAKLYNYILYNLIEEDEYFKGFAVNDMTFIVASRNDKKVVLYKDVSDRSMYNNSFKWWKDLLYEVHSLITGINLDYEYPVHQQKGIVKINCNDR